MFFGIVHVILLLVLCHSFLVTAVDKGNFKTCSQSAFCTRNREFKPSISPYHVVGDSLLIRPSYVTFNILNSQSNVLLTAKVEALEDRTIRFKLDEANPIKKRYQVKDALVREPKLASLKVLGSPSQGNEVVVAELDGGVSVKITPKPFRLDVYSDKNLVVSTNARGLLNVEHYRKKKPIVFKEDNEQQEQNPESVGKGGENIDENAQQEVPHNQEDSAAEEQEPEGMWNEMFKSHPDSKPHGPSSVGLDFSFINFQHIYGIPEHADNFALKTTKNTDPYRLFNLDVFEYDLYNTMALYGSVPLLLSHNEENTVGIFWHNAAETWVDISSDSVDKNVVGKLLDYVKGGDEVPQMDIHIFSESGIIDVFYMLGPKPTDFFRQYAALTGTGPVPPIWSIGYHQCRWNYNDQDDVARVHDGFDEHDIPVDVIWLDIEHTDGKRYFTWDHHKFPNPEEMLANLTSRGRKMVTIVDPHLKEDSNFEVFKDARDQDLFVKDKSGNNYQGWCWPGNSMWPDFLNPAVQEWWASKFNYDSYRGSTNALFTWNDMNEPSVFNGPEVTMHKDAIHFDGWENRDVHNLYGMLVQKATAQGLVARSGGKERPFVLSRAFYAGSQRYGAIWTGDNLADWEHLKISTPMLLSLSVSGISFVGADVGGFFRNPSGELVVRWYQAAAFQPFFRAHAHLDTPRREPWVYSHEEKQRIRHAIRQRYALLQYWYTLFYEHYRTGVPVIRPLWVQFPRDINTFSIDNEFMVGPALLVFPVTEQGLTKAYVYLPGSNITWYDYETFEAIQGGVEHVALLNANRIPIYLRGGTIIPRKDRVRRAALLGLDDPYTLIVALNDETKPTADGVLYIDDGHTFHYQEGHFIYRTFTFRESTLISKSSNTGSGQFHTKSWLERVVIIGLKHRPLNVWLKVNGQEDVKLNSNFVQKGQRNILVIRKPGVNIGVDWSIELVYAH